MGTSVSNDKTGTPTSLLLSNVCAIVVFALAEIQSSMTLGEAFSMRYVLLSYIGLGLTLAFFWKRLEKSPLLKVSSIVYLFGLWVSLFVTTLAPILLDGENPLVVHSLTVQFGLGIVALSGLFLMVALLQKQKMVPGLIFSSMGAVGLMLTAGGSFVYKAQHADDDHLTVHAKQGPKQAAHSDKDDHGEGEEISAHDLHGGSKPTHAAPADHGEQDAGDHGDGHEPDAHHASDTSHEEPADDHHAVPAKPAKIKKAEKHKLAAKALLHKGKEHHKAVASLHGVHGSDDRDDNTNAPGKVQPAPTPKKSRPGHDDKKAHASGKSGTHPHWTYEGGQTTPEHWGNLADEFRTCTVGQHQSPIDIPTSWPLIEDILLDYKLTPVSIVDNGHTIQFNVGGQNFATIAGRRYQLLQFHIHTPSEHWIAGRQSPMEIHFVHKDERNQLAVIGVMIEAGDAQKTFGEMWSFVPQGINKPSSPKNKVFNIASLLPKQPKVYRYSGSLTTPPCSENVLWSVASDTIQLSREQIDAFKVRYRNNARPVQKRQAQLR